MNLLDRHRPAIRRAHAIEPEAGVAGLHLERRREEAVGLDQLSGDDRRAGHLAAREHVLCEGREGAGLRDPRLGDEGSASVQPVHRPLGGQPLDLVAHGHAREPVPLGQLALGRESGPRRERAQQLLEDRPKRLPLWSAARQPGRQRPTVRRSSLSHRPTRASPRRAAA